MERALRRRGLGFLLILTAVLAAGTLVQDYQFDVWLARERDAARVVDQQIDAVTVALADLRAAQTGYVATGQGPQFWMTRASQLIGQIGTSLAALSASTPTLDARPHYDAAVSALGDLTSIDKRTRADVGGNERFEASDLIFVDALEASQRLGGELTAARAAELTASRARITRLSRLRFGMNAAALAFLLAVVSFFRRSATRAEREAGASEPSEAVERRSPLGLSSRHEVPPPIPRASLSTPGGAVPRVTEGHVAWENAAELCVDLARVLDSQDVPALVERSAAVLGAKGVVLWIADPSGAWLRPSLSYGYADTILSRLGSLSTDADNATSVAFRSMRAQIVNGDLPGAPGAVTVPLITPSGCVGVLAAEVAHREPDQDTVAVARIIAAQFATLVAPAEASRAAQA
jgi:hypothetical protein